MSDYIFYVKSDAIDAVAHHGFPLVGQCIVDVVTGFLVSPATNLNNLPFSGSSEIGLLVCSFCEGFLIAS